MKALTTLMALLALVISSPVPSDAAPMATDSTTGSATAEVRTVRVTTDAGRSYLLTAPTGGDVTRLVVVLHWSTGRPAGIRRASNFDAMAAASGGTVVAYPKGINTSWNAGGCCRQNESEDVAFLDGLIADVKATYPSIEHVVMFGQSNGGMMAYRYWFEGAHRIAAFAIQAGALSGGGDFAPGNSVPYPAHLMHWHGAIDTTVPILGRGGDDLRRAGTSPYFPLHATVSMAVAAADADLDQWRVRSHDDASVTVWKGTHTIRLEILPESGHGGEGMPWPANRHSFAWRWLVRHSSSNR